VGATQCGSARLVKRSRGVCRPSGRLPRNREFADGLAGCEEGVGFNEGLHVHGGQGLVTGASDFAGIDESGDAGQDLILAGDIGRPEERPREHEFPRDGDAFELEGAADIEGTDRFDDEHDVTLGGDDMPHNVPVVFGVVEVGDVVDLGEAEGLELGGDGLAVVDDVIGAEFETPRLTFRTRGGGDDGEAGELGELNGDGADATRAADDEEGLAGVVGFEVDVEAIEQGFPSGEAGEGEGRTGRGVEGLRTDGRDALVDELEVGIGTRAGDVAGVVNEIADLEERNGIADGFDGAGGIEAERLGGSVRAGADLGVDGVHPDGFDFDENVVALGHGGRELDFESCVRLIEADPGLELDGFHGNDSFEAGARIGQRGSGNIRGGLTPRSPRDVLGLNS